MSERIVEVTAIGLSLEPSSNADALLERLRPALPVSYQRAVRLFVLPEYASLVFAKGTDATSIASAEAEMRIFLEHLARKYSAYVCAALPSVKGTWVTQRTLLVDQDGHQILSFDKVNLTEEERALGFTSGSTEIIPVVRSEAGCIGVATCLDGFSASYLRDIGGVDFLLMPSANPQGWALPARGSGVWQPKEWQDALEQAARITGAMVVNPMLQGCFDRTTFGGQTSICSYSAVPSPSPFIGVDTKSRLDWLACSPADATGDQVVSAKVTLTFSPHSV